MFKRSPSEDEGGFSAVEVMITTVILAIALVAMLTTLTRANETARYTYDRNEAIDQLRLTADAIAKDLRQATQVTAYSASSITVDTYVDAALATVTWQLSGTDLERVVDANPPALYVVNLVLDPATPVFEYEDGVVSAADISGVTINFSTQPDPRHPKIPISTEVELRNVSL